MNWYVGILRFESFSPKTREWGFAVLSNSPGRVIARQGQLCCHEQLARASDCAPGRVGPDAVWFYSPWARRASLSVQKNVILLNKWYICLYYDWIMILWMYDGVFDCKLGLEWWIELWYCICRLTMIMYIYWNEVMIHDILYVDELW
jgi:hypothetical protein